MRATVKRYSPSNLRVHHVDDHVIIECEVVAPKSAARRAVDVYLDPETVTALLLELRSSAIGARSTGEPS